MAGPALLFLLGYSDVELWTTVARSLEGKPQKAIRGDLTLWDGQWGDSYPALYKQEGLCKQRWSEQRKAEEPQRNQQNLFTCLQ